MKRFLRRPSPSMVVALLALIVAASGTAVAASKLRSGDKLIKKHSLSGNRLRNHTITRGQINFKKLGKVPRARNADTAQTANTVGGYPASAFEPASAFIRTGLVTARLGQTVPLTKFGPFTLSLKCNGTGTTVSSAEIDAVSTEANSDGYGTNMPTAGTSYMVLSTTNGGGGGENNDHAADFFTPSGKTFIADLTVGYNHLGLTGMCYANSLASPS